MMRRMLCDVIGFATAVVALWAGQVVYGDHNSTTTEYEGLIASVTVPDPANSPGVGTVTITTKRNGDVVVNIDSTTTLKLDGQVVTDLSLIPVGDKSEARVNKTTGIATKLSAATPGSKEGKPRTTKEYHGVIASVDPNLDPNVPGLGTVTITTKKSGDVVLQIDTTTKLELDDQKQTDLSLFAVGDKAEAKVDTTTGLTKKLEAETPDFEEDDD